MSSRRRTGFRPFLLMLAVVLCLGLSPAAAYAQGSPHERGLQAMGAEDWDAAVAAFSELIEAEPENAEGYANRGRVYAVLGKSEPAIADFTDALTRGLVSVDLYVGRAFCYAACQEWRRAFDDFRQALALDPTAASVYRMRADTFASLERFDEALADLAEASRLEPQSPVNYYWRAIIRLQQGNFEAAFADLETTIALNPYDGKVYHMRAMVEIGCGNLAQGRFDLETAVQLNAGDSAASFEPWAKTPLSEEDLQHGQEQVRRMLADRPAMRPSDGETSPLCQWAARKFAGEDLGHRISWNPQHPDPRATCQNCPYRAWGYDIKVLGREREGANAGQERPFEDLWHDAVFELYNICNAEQFERILVRAQRGELDKRGYVTQTLNCENLALKKTRAFYLHVFLSCAETQQISTSPSTWCFATPYDLRDDFLVKNLSEDSPTCRCYEQYYDFLTLSTLFRQKDYERASALAEELRPHVTDTAQASYLCGIIGYCRVHQDKPWAAIPALDEAIRLDPEKVDAYTWRAYAYCQLHEMERCVADCTQAIKLRPSSAYAYGLRARAYRALSDTEHAEADEAMAEAMEKQTEPDEEKSDGPWYQSPAGPYDQSQRIE